MDFWHKNIKCLTSWLWIKCHDPRHFVFLCGESIFTKKKPFYKFYLSDHLTWFKWSKFETKPKSPYHKVVIYFNYKIMHATRILIYGNDKNSHSISMIRQCGTRSLLPALLVYGIGHIHTGEGHNVLVQCQLQFFFLF